ncbi:BRO-A [Buzura suppressaria nucleopolyhedrovirus]|uniref:BRO-A n=1 Tax=Buzura suppressaria nuclear polyhedrosis virus TaxID=74320 RepID=W5VKE3_NPVBS|nr:BRO-A [Buzura suppressaria nucleopolyhedrovirus]AHH82626.1 BRO-A [Buzura suppressaria nucleopolyhedrovirus]
MDYNIEHKLNESVAKNHHHHHFTLSDSITTSKYTIQDTTLLKPKNTRLQHAFVVCEMSDNRFAFLRTQLRSINRSLKKLRNNESDTPPSIVLSIHHVPNSISLFNRLKESLPSGKFVAKNNTIKLTRDFNRTMLLNTIKFLITN